MKKNILTLVLMGAFSLTTYAQTPKLGAFLGLNASNMRFSDDDVSIKGESIAGLKLGVSAELDITDQFSIMTMPGISMKGTRIFGEKIALTYFDIPMYGVYNYEVGPGKAFGGLGPYFGFALFGRVGGEKIDFKDEDLKRGDFGFNFMLGYELPDLGIKTMITISPGIGNLSSYSNARINNSSFGIGVAYLLKR